MKSTFLKIKEGEFSVSHFSFPSFSSLMNIYCLLPQSNMIGHITVGHRFPSEQRS